MLRPAVGRFTHMFYHPSKGVPSLFYASEVVLRIILNLRESVSDKMVFKHQVSKPIRSLLGSPANPVTPRTERPQRNSGVLKPHDGKERILLPLLFRYWEHTAVIHAKCLSDPRTNYKSSFVGN
jgi:hypothetical protein